MQKSNRVGDVAGGGNAAISAPPPAPAAVAAAEIEHNAKSFYDRIGLTAIVRVEELAEYRRGRLRFLAKRLVIDANETYFYYWTAIVSLAYVYNLVVRSFFLPLFGVCNAARIF